MGPLDPVTQAIATGSPAAVLGVFMAGAASSLGPCVAPRYLAVAGLSTGTRRPTGATIAFVCGLVTVYVTLGFTAGWAGSIHHGTPVIDAVMGIALVSSGIMMVWQAEPRTGHHCHGAAHIPATHGGPFLLGAASALVVSPCCTPMLAAIVATASALGRPLAGAALLACVAIGHALPLFAAGTIGGLLHRLPAAGAIAQTPAVVVGSLMIGLGAFYGAIA